MAWLCLIVAGVFEIGWPLGLKLGWNEQGVRPLPLTLAIACMALSGLFLLIAQRSIPMGTAYAVWTGIGAIGTFAVGIAAFSEPATAARMVSVGLIAAGIVGLKMFEH
ncbi:DMT family transporter [Bythopirellula polymerisocia]|jgi:quaternary ammonium compound-resistance protein SugE|uniref:Guanidinium exporter n=1 Tax=Bythopirellula polymerisocia TaxID=2528003 RepID=A0A5C6D348_9BACT|nr:multidrug efflux SMR transporter [Bythopirellula polymerisocia]TWU30201.1 Quaternary ammonium compound-resistance protein SugE [Bythopirellula polymerisocia]